MRDYDGHVVEGTRSNLFLALGGRLLTPALHHCGIAGILRGQLLELFGSQVEVCAIPAGQLHEAEELFVCNSVLGVWPVTTLRFDGKDRHLQVGPWAQQALAWFDGILA